MTTNKFLVASLTMCTMLTACNTTEPLTRQESIYDCISCALQCKKISTIGDVVAETQYFFVRQDYAVPIPGFMIISSVRHIHSIDDFTTDEQVDFIALVCKVRCAMREALGIQVVYMIQEEDTDHFHLWLFPYYEWMKKHGKKIKAVKPIMLWAQQHLSTLENMQTVERSAHAIRNLLKNNSIMRY